MTDDDAMTGATASEIQIQEQAGPMPDVVHAFSALPGAGAGTVLLSARDSGIWRSEDGGAAFRQVAGESAPGQLMTATCIAFADSASNQTVFAGAAGMIARSRDGGRQWQTAPLPVPAPLVTCLAISPAFAEDGVILAGTLEDGVLRSDDRGERWKRWNFGLLDLAVYSIVASPSFAAAETVFAGTETALFKSENGGRSWRETVFPEPAPPVLALAIDQRDTIWAGTERHGVWQSADNGGTWQRADDGAITGAVNQLLLAERFSLAVLPDAIWIADHHGRGWRPAFTGLGDSGGIAGVAAPHGITETAPLFVQLRNGLVRQRRIGIDS